MTVQATVNTSAEFTSANIIDVTFERPHSESGEGNSCEDSEVTITLDGTGTTNWEMSKVNDKISLKLCGGTEYDTLTLALEWLVENLRRYR